MKFLVYSEINASNIAASLGKPEYSYYFVLREFLPMLKRLGEVLVMQSPAEVDEHYQRAHEAGEDCVFLSFSPPHKTTLGLRCPTIPVFAWEFDSIPTEVWFDEPEQDWRHGLSLCGRAIVHSELTATVVREAMGEDFPVLSIPAPVWDRFAALRVLPARAGKPVEVAIQSGVLMDTRYLSLEPYYPAPDVLDRLLAARRGEPVKAHAVATVPVSTNQPVLPEPVQSPASSLERVARISLRYLIEWYRLVWQDKLPAFMTLARDLPPPPDPWLPAAHRLHLDGVVFTAVFNPYDGRKNWMDMLTAFCTAFREVEDAVLVFKLTHLEYRLAMESMLMCLGRLPPFRCRIVLLHGYLNEADYHALLGATAYAVNASHGEGQCLPLMEYLSCGKPAIAPRNSAMLDYMDEQVGFVVNSWLDATTWPHDPRVAYRTCRHQLDWTSLVAAYTSAYQCFRDDPERYQQLSANARERMRIHCSHATATARMQKILNIDEKHGQ